MSHRLPAAAAALAVVVSLAGCSTTSSPSPAATSAPAASSTSAAAPTSSSPTTDPAQDKADAQQAAAKFTKAALTFGYPDSVDDYLDRVKLCTTADGFAEFEKEIANARYRKALAKLTAERSRSVVAIRGDVGVSSIDAARAETKVGYRATIQQQRSGKWKAVRTSGDDSLKVDLVKQDGTWLVDHLPAG